MSNQAYAGFNSDDVLSGGWRRPMGGPSLSEAFRSIPVRTNASAWRKFLAFAGPGYLVAVGYMDPGNWATSLSGGSAFGYALLSVALLSNVMAIILQALSARLAVASGRDLAQACRDAFPRWASWPLWLLAEGAIIATDLAEVIGTAIGLQLLFGIPVGIGVVITALDVLLVLVLQSKGFRWIEAFILSLLGVIALCFGVQLMMADPDWGGVISGFVPSLDIFTNSDKMYLALGIIGATVMPHNLYLHSGIVHTRAFGDTLPEKREALKFATLDSTVALMLALGVNAAILILAAATFHATGNTKVDDIGVAHQLLTPLLGNGLAPVLFGIALLACGLTSTITSTMAGQIVMEGFIDIRLTPWLRRLITRLAAILPAIAVVFLMGEGALGQLLILSQVVLSLQLPFAIVPLVMFTASKKKMGELVAPAWLTLVAGLIGVVIIALNLKLIFDVATGL